MKTPLYIVEGIRTPFSKAGTTLSSMNAVDLGRTAVAHLLSTTGINPEIIDETIIGCMNPPISASNLSRVIALRSGIPESIPASTVNRNCASGLEAITQAYEKMNAGKGEVFLVGGTESMSNIPLLFSEEAKVKFDKFFKDKSIIQKITSILSFRPSDFSPVAGLKLSLTDPVNGLNMGQTAELLAREFNITRKEQDWYSLESHRRACNAKSKLAEEICPAYPDDAHYKNQVVDKDNGPRKDQRIEVLEKLKSIFEEEGTVTAGNASQITDGAGALLVATEKACNKHGFNPIGKLTGYHYSGCNPSRMGLGPLHAIAGAEEEFGLGLKDADIIEINEAFAAQVIACIKASESNDFAQKYLARKSALGEIPHEKLNVNGGSIAIGHPVGSTGTRLVLTALKELKRRKQKRALVSLCVGGGQGGALWIESL